MRHTEVELPDKDIRIRQRIRSILYVANADNEVAMVRFLGLQPYRFRIERIAFSPETLILSSFECLKEWIPNCC